MIQIDVATRADLRHRGLSLRRIAHAVDRGELIRARRDRYLPPDTPRSVVEAVRIGGRVTCLSLLQELGVFVFANTTTHVHVPRGASRLRSGSNSRQPLAPRSQRGEVVHWLPLVRPDEAGPTAVSIVDALVHATRCQRVTHAVATLDSALNLGLIAEPELAEILSALPARYGVLRKLVDARAQAGTETLVRLMARRLGCRVELQVRFDEVGYVDLLIDEWLAVECDSRQFHSDWRQQRKDFTRNRVLAALGISTLRLTAEDILYRSDDVFAALRGLVLSRR